MSLAGKNHETDFSAQMTAVAEANEQLRDTDGFLVESSEGDIGWVEEIWVGEANEPRALALQTRDGRHALLPAEEVLAVEREQRWVVVPPQPTLLELGPPHLTKDGRDGSGMRMTASWATTGAPIAAPTRPSWRWRLRLPRPRSAAVPRERERAERPLWQVIAMLYASLAFTVVFVIALAFAIARLVSGAAY
jgi:hypothetical protein